MRSRNIVEHLDLVDTSTARAVPEGALEALHSLGVTVGGRFDAAVRQIADPPVHALAGGGLLREVSEANALNTSAD